MTEVSGKTLELFRRIAERTGVAADELFVGSGHSPDRTWAPEYIPWRDFCVLCRNARRACGSDQRLADMGSDLRATRLSSANQAGLEARDWPNNFDDLRDVAKHLDLIHREGSLRKAAERLKVPLATYHYLLRGFGVSTPLL